MSHDGRLLIGTLVAVAGLIVGITRFKLHAFIALMLAALFVGVCAGMEPAKIATGFQAGVGAMLGSIAVVVGLGVILGQLLVESGGAEVVARQLIAGLGAPRAGWTMLAVGLIVGIPVFFTVGLVLLMPVLRSVARETQQSVVVLGIPLLAGLSVVHGLLPPHPGPLAAIGTFNQVLGKTDLGKTILYALLLGAPAAVIAGPVFARFVARQADLEPVVADSAFAPLSAMAAGAGSNSPVGNPPRDPGSTRDSETRRPVRDGGPPACWLVLFVILLPVLLMLLSTFAQLALPISDPLRRWTEFTGDPNVAMLIAVLVALSGFGLARGFDRQRLLKLSNDCLPPVANILLVVGAGGGFSGVLQASGVGQALADLARGCHLSPLLLGWLTAALIRVGTGSATVAITLAAGLVAPIAAAASGVNRELLVLATGAGSLILSHVNDGGFWFVKEYFGLSATQTLKTWTVLETILSVVTLALVLLANRLL
ncbi:MAG: GntP family permease [Verrucomicrobia bacterium]|nr:GntP family permease [Verrucomicrobiota bacterium]